MLITALPRPITEVLDSLLGMKLGALHIDSTGNVYKLMAGVASTVAGDWVVYSAAHATVRSTKTEVDKLKPLAIAMAATVANKYGWYQVYGEVAVANVLASCAAEVAVYSTATAGSLDDEPTSQTKINRAICRAARGGTDGSTTAFIAYPSAG